MASVQKTIHAEDSFGSSRPDAEDASFDTGRPTFTQGGLEARITEGKFRNLYNSSGTKVATISSGESKMGHWLGDGENSSASTSQAKPKKKNFMLYNSRGDRVGTVVARDAPSPTTTVTAAAEKLLREVVLGGGLEFQRSSSLPECTEDSERANQQPPSQIDMSPIGSKTSMSPSNSFTALFSDGKKPKKNFVLFNSKGQKVATLFNSSQTGDHSSMSEAEERLADCTVQGPPRSAVPTLLANERARRLFVELPDKALKA